MAEAARALPGLRGRLERALAATEPWPWLVLVGLLAVRGIQRRPTFDFSCYRDAAVALGEGGALYPEGEGVFFYAPVFAALFRPFAWASPELGSAVWTAASVAALAGAVWLTLGALRRCGEEVPAWAPLVAVLMVARSAANDFGHGNANALLVLLVASAYHAWSPGPDGPRALRPVRRTLSGGLALALAISMKLTPAILLPWLLVKRDLAALAATGAGLALWLALVPAVSMGPAAAVQHTGDWLHHVLLPTVAPSPDERPDILQGSGSSLPAAVPMLLSRARGEDDEVHPSWPILPAGASRGVAVGLSLLLGVATFAATARRSAWGLELPLVVALSLLVAPVSRSGHFLQLLPLAAWLLCRAAAAGPDARIARRGVLAAVALFGAAVAAGKLLAGSSKALYPLLPYALALWAAGLGILWRSGGHPPAPSPAPGSRS